MDMAEARQHSTDNYAIFNPKECNLLSVFFSLFPDASARAMRCTPSLRSRVDSSFQAKFGMWMMAVLHTIAAALALVGKYIEIWLNTFHINGGLIKMILKKFEGTALLVPEENSANYWTLIGLLDPRTDLLVHQYCDEFRDHSSFFGSENPASKLMADACMMVSKLAYENPNTITRVVTEDWKMHVADILECINKSQPKSRTQISIIIDRAEDAQAIIVAFRGTMPFNAYDWSTNFDSSWYELPGLGRVHVGCLEALSMVDRQDMASFIRLKRNILEKLEENLKHKDNEHAAEEPYQTIEVSEGLQSVMPSQWTSVISELKRVQSYNGGLQSSKSETLPAENVSGYIENPDIENPGITSESTGVNPNPGSTSDSTDPTSDVFPYNLDREEIPSQKKTRPFISGLSEANEENMHRLAYDAVRDTLKELLETHKKARVFITGHSLGGATATVFTSLLFHSKEDAITSRLAAVYTFGQPKVGDPEFASNMMVELNLPENRFFRVVYSNDLISRLPFGDLVFRFKHLGPCFFYSSNYESETVNEEPSKSFTSGNLLPSQATATWELLQSLMLQYKFGEAYKETVASTVFRVVGLFFPGIAAHSPVNYVNAIRLGPEILDAEVMPSYDNKIED